MPAPRRRAALLVPGGLLLSATLSGCLATVNFDSQTDQPYTPADGVNERSGEVNVLNALIVSEAGGTGRLIAGLVNKDLDEPDALTAVEGIEEFAEVTVSVEGGDSEIPAGGLLQLADDDAANVVVAGDPELVALGTFVRLRLSFESASEVEVNVPVLPPGTDYTEVELPPATTTSAGEG